MDNFEEKKIIIIDDDPIFVKYIERIIQGQNFISVSFESIDKAFEYLHININQICLIIIDVFLSDQQFQKFLQLVKNDFNTKYIPIMAITGEKGEERSKILSYAFNHNIDDFLLKPIHPTEFVLRMTRLIQLNENFTLLNDRIKGSDKLVYSLEKKLSEISEIHNKLKTQHQRQAEYIQNNEESFYSLAHDIKSSLSNIILSMEMLLKDKNDFEQNHELIEIAKNTAKKMNEDIMHYLDRVKNKEEIQELEVSEVDPANILEIVLRTYYPEANQHKILITLELPENIEHVFWDQSKIIRVVSNLVDNAIKYSPQNEVITLQLDQHENITFISVIDHGPGISEDSMSKIFDMFYQGENAKKGFGIGLGWCKKTVENHKGSVKVESKEGHGTKVIVELPNKVES